MARPSKLTDKQKSEIQRRYIAGETTRELARAFKVGQATISTLVSGRTKTIKTLAGQIVANDAQLASLPVSDQCSVMTLVDQLKSISRGLAAAADHNAQTAARLAKVANERSSLLVDLGEGQIDEADLKSVAMLVETANRASTIGVNLLNANKDKASVGELTLEQLITGDAK
jgi:hypothetical protein